MDTDPLAPLAGGTYRIQVVQPAAGSGHELLLILLALNVLLLGALVLFTLFGNRRTGAAVWLRRHNWRRTLTETLLGGVALYFLWSIRSLLPPFLIAFFLASLLDPVVTNMQRIDRARSRILGFIPLPAYFQRRHRSRGEVVASIFIVAFLSVTLLVVLLVRFAAPQMEALIAQAPSRAKSFTGTFNGYYEKNKTTFKFVGIQSNPLTDRTGPVLTAVTGALGAFKDSVVGFAGKVLWLIIIPLSLFYFLLEYQLLRAKLISFVPPRYQPNIDKMSQEIVDIFSQYVRGLAKVCVLYAIAMTVLFGAVFRLDYFVFLGIAAGVLYAVPYVGPALAMGSAGIIALTMDRGPAGAVLVVVCFVVIHVTFDYIITPRVVGGSVGLHPLVNVFALTVGATLFGVWGMLLAVPVAASVQMVLIYFFPKLTEKPVLVAVPALAPTPDERLWEESAAPVD